MRQRRNHDDFENVPAGVNPGYAWTQLAKAIGTYQDHDDPQTRERAQIKIAKWHAVLQQIREGSASYGSRTPIAGAPAWATLEVVTGGFATGQLLASGELQDHEQQLFQRLQLNASNSGRKALNDYYLTDEGICESLEVLKTGCYEINVPEEGALLVVAWLLAKGLPEQARSLLNLIYPYFGELRFYPVPRERPLRGGSRVHLQEVRMTVADLERIKPNKKVLAQKEAVEVWAPYLDRMIAIFLETVVNEWPCRHFPDDWALRAAALESEFAILRRKHKLCGKPEQVKGHFAQLRAFLSACIRDPRSLSEGGVRRLQIIIQRYVKKRGTPDSLECAQRRHQQLRAVEGPLHYDISQIVLKRLSSQLQDDGLDDVAQINRPVSVAESEITTVAVGSPVPKSIQRKVERCLNETVSALVERGLISSGETLARVLPQMTSGIRAAGISDPVLRQLYSSIYRAFRRRRSLLLLNLDSQIRIEELPWVAAIDQYRNENLSTRELAQQTLEETVVLAITAFPYAILPNKLLQELRALIKTADLDIPLVDEVAADIFMGSFSNKFVEAAKRSAKLLEGTIYSRYYDIDSEAVRMIPIQDRVAARWFRHAANEKNTFAEYCAKRAGVSLGTWDAATNGMIIEQQQILTTQNLAILLASLDLTNVLQPTFGDLAMQSFKWVCARLQMKTDKWHAQLIAVKNSAYAWRQMIFYLALLPAAQVEEFLVLAKAHLAKQTQSFMRRFSLALTGLELAANGVSLDKETIRRFEVVQFLGWLKGRHWLLAENSS